MQKLYDQIVANAGGISIDGVPEDRKVYSRRVLEQVKLAERHRKV